MQNKAERFVENNPVLAAFRRKRLIQFVLKCIALEAVVVAVAVGIGSNNFVSEAVIFGVLAGIALPIVFLNPARIFSRALFGRIEEITYENRLVSTSTGVANKYGRPQRGYRRRTESFMICKVLGENGKKRSFNLPKTYEKVFGKGDVVLRPDGIPYPFNLTPRGWQICPLCGNVMPASEPYCVGCGETFDASGLQQNADVKGV